MYYVYTYVNNTTLIITNIMYTQFDQNYVMESLTCLSRSSCQNSIAFLVGTSMNILPAGDKFIHRSKNILYFYHSSFSVSLFFYSFLSHCKITIYNGKKNVIILR